MEKVNEALGEEKFKKLVDICNQIRIGFHVKPDQIRIARFSEGSCSEIYRVDFIENNEKDESCKTIVIKLFRTNPPYDLNKSRINSIMIGLANLAPKVLLSKDDALVLQYINGRLFTYKDDHDEKLVKLLAYKLAHFHSLEIPIAKNLYLDQITYVLKDWMNENIWMKINDQKFQKLLKENRCNNLIEGNPREEFRNLEQKIISIEPNIVFAHQDLNHSNIFIIKNNNYDQNNNNSEQFDIKFIDFDYSGYNFRAMDLGRYFSDSEKLEQFSNEGIINDDKMLVFIKHYIDANCKIYSEQYRLNPNNSSEKLLFESKLFVMWAQMIDIFFCLWRAIEEPSKRDEFCKNAESRFEEYLKFKKRIQNDKIF